MTIRHVPRFARTDTPRGDDAATPDAEVRKMGSGASRRAAAKRFREVEVTGWLMDRHGLDPEHARGVAVRLLSSTPRIRGAFQKWWLTGRVEDLQVEGYDLPRLVEEKGMSVLGALLALSLLEARGSEARRELDESPGGDIDVDTALRLAEG